ncbi:hypothetical protein HF325_004313 [Metschnikowia pulcherrima]|uniref:Uncharacterized protein n=1 Tax=Metschnikowia pulcherrima TaxID=27326 RepID=A0A8H7LE89_9ASCO|nr:hypothetical protein HF325_004313 [Metschnikowia pulcherrima]
MSEPIVQPNPVKRKRGRPPKANKPEDAFPTFTMQLKSSPFSGGPNAELTSSQVVRIGEPDSFTPMMKVLPSPHRKKRSKSSSFSLPLDPSRFPKHSESQEHVSKSYVTSTADRRLPSRVLDDLSAIMDTSPRQPQQKVSIKSLLGPGIILLPGKVKDSFVHVADSPSQASDMRNVAESSEAFERTELDCRAQQFTSALELPWDPNSHRGRHDDLDLFGFDLIIDESGKAELVNKQNFAPADEHQFVEHLKHDETLLGGGRSPVLNNDDQKHVVERTRSLPALGRIHDEHETRQREDANDYDVTQVKSSPNETPDIELPQDYGCHPSILMGQELSPYQMIVSPEKYCETDDSLHYQSELQSRSLSLSLDRHHDFDSYLVDTEHLTVGGPSSEVAPQDANIRDAHRAFERRD